jgi:IPT/TIG domain
MRRKPLSFVHLLIAAAFLILTTEAFPQVPYGFQFVSTREAASNVLYDSFHQHFYVTVPGENLVYVVNEADGAVVQKVSVPSPFGLDLSVDGTRLFVTSSVTILGYGAAQGYFVIDTTTLHVVDFVQPTMIIPSAGVIPSTTGDNIPRFVAALSNGKVAYSAEQTGVTGGSIFLNDPATNLATNIAYAGYYDGAISKALNGSAFVAVSGDSAGEAIAVFDTASNSYVANKYFSSTNNSDVVMSPDGSQVLAGGHLLLDRNLNQIADLNPSAGFARSSTGSTFSVDGSRIYVASTLSTTAPIAGGGSSLYSNPVLAVYNAATHQLLGYIPLPANIIANTVQAVAVGTSGKAVLTSSNGFLELNASSPNINLPAAASQSLGTPNTTNPFAGVAANPAATTVSGAGFRSGATVFFGQAPATATVASQNVINVQPPAATPGLVPITVGFPDGWALLAPKAYSYGPVITDQDVTAGDSNGGAVVTLTGYGFNVTTGYPQITVGGRTATVTAFSNTFTPQSVTFTVPAGVVGHADIQLTSLYGTTTSKSGFQYLKQQTIPSVLPLQMVVDNARNQLYIADYASGNVLAVDAVTLAVKTLFSSSTSPASALAITPDASQLLVASYSGGTLDIIDLATGNHLKTIIPVPGNIPGPLAPNNVVATSRGTAILSFDNTSLFEQGAIYEVNLATGAAIPLLLGTQNTLDVINSTLLAASADGTRVYITPDGNVGFDGGAIDIWQAASGGSTQEMHYDGGIDQIATTDSGDRLLGDSYTYDTSLRRVTTSAPDSTLVHSRDLVLGEKLHSSGSLVYMPTTKGVEIFDVHTGATVLSIGNAPGSLEGPDNLAINHAGSRLYLSQKSGVAVIDLETVPLSIGSLTPSRGDAAGGTTVVLRGSGFLSGVSVTVDGRQAAVQFVDSTKLILTTPSVTAAKDIVTVTNPDGTAYSLDAAFDATAYVTPNPPVLTAVSPSFINASSTLSVLITGSGFTPSTLASMNGIPGATTFFNSTQIKATFYGYPGAGKNPVTATNPPNATPSNPVYVTTFVDGPFLGSIAPTSIPAGSASFTLALGGNTLFSPGSIALWNGTPLPTTYVNSSTLLATVPASDVTAVGTATITVSAPLTTVGPPVSNPQTFTITPSIAAAAISPSSATFGPVLLGNSTTSTFTVSSTGQLPLSITAITLSDTSRFSQTNTCTSALQPGQSCTVLVTFKPDGVTSLGVAPSSGTMTIMSNSAATPPVVRFTSSVGDLRFLDSPSTYFVFAGKSIMIPVNFATYGSIPNASMQFSCSGLPQGSSCTFNPPSAQISVTGTVNLTISTTGNSSASLQHLRRGEALLAGLLLFGVYGVRRRQRIAGVFTLLLSSLLLIGLSACSSGTSGGTGGGGGNPGGPANPNATPPGVYAITITATSGGATRTTIANVTVTSSS